MTGTNADKLEGLRLRLALARAAEENRLLKNTVHEEVDALRAGKKTASLRAKLRQLEENEARGARQLCYGLPPGWRSGQAANGGAGEWTGHWQSGTEVCYTARLVGPPGSQRLEVQHSERTVCLQLYRRPFAHGGLREAFFAMDKSSGRFVVKRELVESHKLQKRLRVLHADAEAAALSQAVADGFNAAAGQPGAVQYLAASIVVLESGVPDVKCVYLKEPWLDTHGTKWVKYTRNDGTIFSEGPAAATVHAFTHFSLTFLRAHLGCDAMVLDAQGIQCPGLMGGKARFKLTDPAVCTADARYGRADMGPAAMATFMQAHTCCAVCTRCGCSGVRCSPVPPS